MILKISKIILLSLFLLGSFVAKADDVLIRSINIVGNEKTKKSAILRWAGVSENKVYSEIAYEEIVENLNRAGQFNLKDISLVDSVLTITVEEKWSIFPVPLLTQSGSYFSRGLLLYENNFMGRLGTIAPGLFWTNSGINAIFYWQEDNVIAQNWGMKVLLLHRSDLTEFDRGGETIKSFESRLDTVILTPNFKHGRHDHKFGPIYMRKKVYEEGSNKVFWSERYGTYYRYHYNRFKKLPILYDGYKTTYDFFFIPRGRDYDFLQAGDIEYVKPLGSNFLKLQFHLSHTSSDTYLSPKMLGGNEGFRGYSRESLPAQSNVGGLVQYKYKLWKSIFTSPFVEYNYTKLIKPVLNGAKLSETAAGINISYYFKKVSIPAVILEYARNIDNKSNHIHLNVGLSL